MIVVARRSIREVTAADQQLQQALLKTASSMSYPADKLHQVSCCSCSFRRRSS